MMMAYFIDKRDLFHRKLRLSKGIAMTSRFLLLIVSCFICALTSNLLAQTPEPKLQQFIYVLRLVPRLYSETAWTKGDEAVLTRHLERFKKAIETGQLVMAGRTMEPGEKTFGIAIFEATDEAQARAFMEADPAVAGGLMTAELHPFKVVLEHKVP
jgi:uncharacterized protein YciI